MEYTYTHTTPNCGSEHVTELMGDFYCPKCRGYVPVVEVKRVRKVPTVPTNRPLYHQED